MTKEFPKGCVFPYEGRAPKIDESVFLAPTACVIGNVEVEKEASVWFGVVLRGDEGFIHIGERTNIQDSAVVHSNNGEHVFIGSHTTIGHGAIIHGCKIGDGALVGMGAIVLDGAEVESGALVAAGALIGPGKRVPANTLWAGVPAVKVRDIGAESEDRIVESAEHYRVQAGRYRRYQS